MEIWIFSAVASLIALLLFLPTFPREKSEEEMPLDTKAAAEGVSP